MPLMLDDKKAIVAEVSEVAGTAISAVAADYRGLSVSAMTQLRVSARAAKVYVRVVRNTLAKRALADTEFACMNESLTGPLILAFSDAEPSAPARLFQDFAKEHEHLQVKVLALGGELYDDSELGRIAKLPTKEEAISQLMSVMIAPVSKLVRTLAEPQAKLVRTIAAVRDQKEA